MRRRVLIWILMGLLPGLGGARPARAAIYDALQQAALDGNLGAVEKALQKAPKLLKAKGGRYSASLLVNAVYSGNASLVKYLLDRGISPTGRDAGEQTPMYAAAFDAKKEVVDLLLAHGADVKGANASGVTPLHVAASEGHPELVDRLIARGANVNARIFRGRQQGQTPLYVANESSQFEAVAMRLVAKGADVNAADARGSTPLHATARVGNRAVAVLLLKKGASVNARTKEGFTALKLAKQHEHKDVAELLLAKGGKE